MRVPVDASDRRADYGELPGGLSSPALPSRHTSQIPWHRIATAAYAAERDLGRAGAAGHSRPETTSRYAAVPTSALTTGLAGVGIRLPVAKGAGRCRMLVCRSSRVTSDPV